MKRAISVALVLLGAACGNTDESVASPPAKAPAKPPAPPAKVKPKQVDQPMVSIETPKGPVTVTVELARTPRQIQRGLMYRQHMAPDRGMLFLLPIERVQSFWMKNTLIPLDILFIRSDMVIAGIVENAEPRTTTSRTVGKPSTYVLEVNGGWSKKHGVTAGMKVSFKNVPAHTPKKAAN